MHFKLAMLIDKDFDSADSLKSRIAGSLDDHYSILLKKPHEGVSDYLIKKIYREFTDYMNSLTADCSTAEIRATDYYRVITGNEAETIINRIKAVWGYVNTDYWFPLRGDEPESVENKFFVMAEYAEAHWDAICKLSGVQDERVYSYGESIYDLVFCTETDNVDPCFFSETVYTDKSFTWMIYFSHEGTVSFAGSIVENVKNLLVDEKSHWNRYEG